MDHPPCAGVPCHQSSMLNARQPAYPTTCSPQGHYCPSGVKTACDGDEYNPLLGGTSDVCTTCTTVAPRFTSYAGAAYCTIPYVETDCGERAAQPFADVGPGLGQTASQPQELFQANSDCLPPLGSPLLQRAATILTGPSMAASPARPAPSA